MNVKSEKAKIEPKTCEIMAAKGLCGELARHYVKVADFPPQWCCDYHLKDLQSTHRPQRVIKTLGVEAIDF